MDYGDAIDILERVKGCEEQRELCDCDCASCEFDREQEEVQEALEKAIRELQNARYWRSMQNETRKCRMV